MIQCAVSWLVGTWGKREADTLGLFESMSGGRKSDSKRGAAKSWEDVDDLEVHRDGSEMDTDGIEH
jgi:hypothetical protein